MKFTEKYEILELLASGPVSTFLARERITREQAVVHTFECPANFPVESRNSSILKHFASIAPIPTEPLTEVGFDEGSSSAYLVTRVPAPGALQSWVRAYRSFPGGAPSGGDRKELSPTKQLSPTDENATAELSASEVERLLKQSGRAKNHRSPEASSPASTEPFSVNPPADPSPQKRDFTKLLEGAGAFQRLSGKGTPGRPVPADPFPPGPASTPPSPPPASPEPKSASFTDEFLAVTDAHSDRTAFGSIPAQERPGAREPGAFTKEFLAFTENSAQSAQPAADRGTGWERTPDQTSSPTPEFPGKPKPVSPISKAPDESFNRTPEASKSTGEFTSFFRGPFDQPSTPNKAIEFPDPVHASPPPRPGDFTQMFGDENRSNTKESPGTMPPDRQAQQPVSFTQIFSEEVRGGARLGDLKLGPDSRPPDSLKPPAASTISSSGMPIAFSGTISPPASRGGSFSPPEERRAPGGGESTFVGQSGRSDATNVFKPRGADAPVVEPAAPSGPSDFTMFISSSQLKTSLSPEGANPAAPKPGGRAPALPLPSMPSYAAPAPPPMPPPPPMPQMAVPQTPPAPRPPAAPPSGGATSYWPLITVLTVLFAIAALLVMYFALKH